MPGSGERNRISQAPHLCDSDVAIYSVQNGVSQPQTATYRPTDSTSMTDHEDSGSPQAAHEAPDSLLTLRLSPAKSWALLTVSVSSSLPCPGTSPVSFPAASRSHPFSLLMVFSRPALGRAQEVGNRPVPSHQDAPWCCGEVMGISPSRLLGWWRGGRAGVQVGFSPNLMGRTAWARCAQAVEGPSPEVRKAFWHISVS
ncbi:uncharacterized protein LOC130542137 isoform X2 [Ursus arctos]|uniref:uncharacterized protein LOC130542137 isoform X2 n=1 Tax=Ursus arctos TaxID=9644 RepID=UPI002546C22F|nr:uncharacterized protein LOC130542137 isoform X2 [Ursus arctos]